MMKLISMKQSYQFNNLNLLNNFESFMSYRPLKKIQFFLRWLQLLLNDELLDNLQDSNVLFLMHDIFFW